jgi:hypothetical protein
VLRAQGRPQSEEAVVCISKGPSTPDGHEAGIADLREDHDPRLPPAHIVSAACCGVSLRPALDSDQADLQSEDAGASRLPP